MKIGIICNQMENKSTKIEKIHDYGAVELYRISIRGKGKNVSKRKLKRIAELSASQGISLCVAGQEFFGLAGYGMTIMDEEYDVLLRRAGQAAYLFSEVNGLNADFLIDGGGFRDVYSATLFLLRRKRHVYITNPAFYELSDEIFAETGAVVRNDAPENVIVISMNKRKDFIQYGRLSADLADFKIRVEGFDFPELPEENMRALVSILEKSGFLEKKRVKIEYFLK